MPDTAIKAHLAQHLMRASLAAHDCRFADLPQTAKGRVLVQAERAYKIESLVLASRQAQDIVLTPQMLERAYTSIRERYKGSLEFLADLEANGLDEQRLREALKRELVADAVLEKVAADQASATAQDARQRYDAHPERFSLPQTRTARHILITVNEEFEDNSRSKALAQMKSIRTEFQGTTESFAALALRHSECPSAMNGGSLGNVTRGTLFAELDGALFQMQEGEVSGILESEAGVHILLCEAIHLARSVSFEEAAPKILESMNAKRRADAQKRWVSSLLASEGGPAALE